ncbi:MAG: 3-oxoacyl-ACP synthase III [Oligoflexus sp.]
MRYKNVYLDTISYALPEERINTRDLEEKLRPLYQQLKIPLGQLEYMTGIRQRRWWPKKFQLSDGALLAAEKALHNSQVMASELDALVYTGVCRDQFEPATACRVAALLGMKSDAWVYDISNACLGVLNGIVDLANRIELGQITCGMVVSCEDARTINEASIERMLRENNLDAFKSCLATLTGGSGAVAVILTSRERSHSQAHQLIGGAVRHAAEHHQLCQWGIKRAPNDLWEQYLNTDAVQVLQQGVRLGVATWRAFTEELQWNPQDIDRVVTHQVGKSHRDTILRNLEIPVEKDYSTFEYLGNIGTVSLPISAAIAAENGFLQPGHRVSLLGIGSGLNCLMLGVAW